MTDLFRSTYRPPTRWVRFKTSLTGFITHPAVIAAQGALILGLVLALVFMLTAKGWI